MNKTNISKKLAFLLRHCIEPLYIDLDGGWADSNVILKALQSDYPDVNMELLEEIVSEDKKGRYSFDENHKRIRANQGHSIKGVVILMDEPEPPELLYHGTAIRFLNTIMTEGLKPMKRQFVHISSDIETAIDVGKRHGKPVVLIIRARDLAAAGHKLYRSSNGVWLTDEVPTDFFTIHYINKG